MADALRHSVRGLQWHLLHWETGDYRLKVGLSQLRGDDETGILAEWQQCQTAVAVEETVTFDVHGMKGGPGQLLAYYHPKEADIDDKLRPTLISSRESAAAAAQGGEKKGKWKRKEANGGLKMVEKRLDVKLWSSGGTNLGRHFPLATFTQNPCRRSPDAYEKRQKKTWGKWQYTG